MITEQAIFYLLGILVLGSALLVVTTANLIRSLFLFFSTLFCMAGLFVFALADFIAITQIVIYVGGVLVLMLFAFLLSNKELLNNLQGVKLRFIGVQQLLAILVSLVFFFILISLIIQADVAHLNWIQGAFQTNIIQPTDNTTHQLGINLMTKYLLPFEILSILLMMALIGAAHLARKEKLK